MISDVIITSGRLLSTRPFPEIASPVAAEIEIEHDLLRRKIPLDVAAAAKGGYRNPPMRRLWDAGYDIQGHTTAWPKPHPDGYIAELGCEDATAIRIEGWTV